MTQIRVIGVYPIPAPEPVHLVELLVSECDAAVDISRITQPMPGNPPDSWQVPWEEHFLDVSGSCVLNPNRPDEMPRVPDFRIAFFFHYLKLDRQLATPFGALVLPAPSKRPARLAFLCYEQPC